MVIAVIYPPRSIFKLHTDDFLVRAQVIQQQPNFLSNSSSSNKFNETERFTKAFYFFGEENQRTVQLKEYGALPWWSDNQAQMAVFRPISALTHFIDHSWLSSNFLLIQLHSLLWFICLSLAVYFFYKKIGLPSAIAVLACLIFLIDLNHMFNFYWLAARNSFIAPLFGILSLISHIQWRQDRKFPYMILGWVSFCLGLLSAEASIAIGAYLFSYAIFLDPQKPLRGIAAIIPYGIIVIMWLAFYSLSGYGAKNIGLYLDPLNAPLDFAQSFFSNALYILGATMSATGPILPVMSENSQSQFLLFSGSLLTLSTVLIWPLLKDNKQIRFFYCGFILAVIPFCTLATYTPRTGIISYLGFSALLASLIIHYLKSQQQRYLKYAFVIFALICHIIVPLGFSLNLSLFTSLDTKNQNVLADLEHGLPGSEDKVTIYLNYPSEVNAMFLPYTWQAEGIPSPKGLIRLAPGLNSYSLRKITDKEFLLTSDSHFVLSQNAFLSSHANTHPKTGLLYGLKQAQGFVSNPKRQFIVGETIQLPLFTVDIEALQNNLPSQLRFRLNENLSPGDLDWRIWDWNQLAFKELPSITDTTQIRVLNQWDQANHDNKPDPSITSH